MFHPNGHGYPVQRVPQAVHIPEEESGEEDERRFSQDLFFLFLSLRPWKSRLHKQPPTQLQLNPCKFYQQGNMFLIHPFSFFQLSEPVALKRNNIIWSQPGDVLPRLIVRDESGDQGFLLGSSSSTVCCQLSPS